MNAIVAIAIVLMLLTSSARASDGRDQEWVTPGWAGYVIRGAGGPFTSVRASWIQPRVICNRPESAVSFWVGLGGTRTDSASLEQIGTSADCDGRGAVALSAWYELFPAPPVDVPVNVRAGDVVTASVSVAGTRLTVTLANRTMGTAFAHTGRMPFPATDSAEWIAEAPGECFSSCTTMPLAAFAPVRFAGAHATTSGHDGSISDAGWTASRAEMDAAATSGLSTDGASFVVRRSSR